MSRFLADGFFWFIANRSSQRVGDVEGPEGAFACLGDTFLSCELGFRNFPWNWKVVGIGGRVERGLHKNTGSFGMQVFPAKVRSGFLYGKVFSRFRVFGGGEVFQKSMCL